MDGPAHDLHDKTRASGDEPLADAAMVRFWRWLQRSGSLNALGRFFAFFLIFMFFAVLVGSVKGGNFCSPRNLESLLVQSCVYGTAAVGMTIVIIAAGIDLSVGSVIALTMVVAAWTANLHYADAQTGKDVYLITHYPVLLPAVALVLSVLAATLAGAVNGAAVVWLRLVPFIVTLGTMGIFRGLAKLIAHEQPIYAYEHHWLASIMDRGGGLLPVGVWIFIISAVAAALLLRYTRFGRHVFAVGSNEETARLCGVPVQRTKLLVYALAGFYSGLAGLMQFAYDQGHGIPTEAIGYELFVIAAVVIGGGSLMGGVGSILGSVLGALIIAVLKAGSQQMGWPQSVQDIMIGAIIIGAVAVDQLRHRRAA